MRFISITKSINIRLDWANITGTVLKAGTPISLTGVVANTADAVGILAQDVGKSDAVVAVVTEGTIDLGEIAASYGELDDAAISAMHGITFIDDGEPVAPGGGLPDYSEASDGDVLSIESGAPAWVTPSGGGNAAWNDALKNIVIVTLEITGANAANLECVCSDGVVVGQMYFVYDPETGDTSIEFGDWSNSEENPVPAADFSAITAALETAIFSHYYAVVPGYYVDITTIEQRIIVCR